MLSFPEKWKKKLTPFFLIKLVLIIGALQNGLCFVLKKVIKMVFCRVILIFESINKFFYRLELKIIKIYPMKFLKITLNFLFLSFVFSCATGKKTFQTECIRI